MSPTRRNASLGHLSSGLGMFGCMDTQVHKRIVRMQLRMMFPSDLHPFGSSQEGPGASSCSGETRDSDCRPRGDAWVTAKIAKMSIMMARR